RFRNFHRYGADRRGWTSTPGGETANRARSLDPAPSWSHDRKCPPAGSAVKWTLRLRYSFWSFHASADDVVDKALNYVFSKDRDFQDFLKTPEAKQISSTLRVRKAPSSEAMEQPAKKA